MNIRITAIILILASLGLTMFSANEIQSLSGYRIAGVVIAVISMSLSSLALAFGNLQSISFMFVTRTSGIVLLILAILNNQDLLLSVAISINALILLTFYSEKLISLISIDAGIANEDTFTLKSPASVVSWFSFVWLVFWLTFMESIHLMVDDEIFLGVATLTVSFVIFALSITSQMRLLLRRCVIVPYGIVLSDLISLTDVVLFPIAKIKSLTLVDEVPEHQELAFTTHRKRGKVALLELTQATDSLIIRNTVNETTRKNVTHVYISVATPTKFVDAFHTRFHKSKNEPLSDAQEKMIEKKLGIETAPRSDSKLPQWKKKTKSPGNDS